MDLDAYTAAHGSEWAELERLARARRLTGDESDELISRFQSSAAQLSAMTSVTGQSRAADRLSLVLSRARLRFTGVTNDPFAGIPRFFVTELPAALYRLRWLTAAIAGATVVIAVLFALWAARDPAVLPLIGDPADLKKLADSGFTDYYSDNPAAAFTGQVWTNNAWIAAQCIAFGIVGIYVPYVIVQNAMNIGLDAAVLFSYGRGDTFFAYVLPHGLLELTSIFVASAAGLRIFWAWVAPGARTRAEALAEEGRALFIVAIGTCCSLLVSGLIEGFVTPSHLPVWLKLLIGVTALAAFLTYMIHVGGRAARSGETGDVDEFERGSRRIVAG